MSERAAGLGDLFSDWTKAWQAAISEGNPFQLALRAFDPQLWPGLGSGDNPFANILGLPRFAGFPTVDRKILKLIGGWLVLAQRTTEQSHLVSQAWAQAYAEFLTELNRGAAEGRPVGAGREFVDRWSKTLNVHLLELQRSGPFLTAQRQVLDAMLSNRASERELIELLANFFDLPTRTELDDAHRSLHELKREVRRMRRELDAVKAGAPVALPENVHPSPTRQAPRPRAKGGNSGIPGSP